MIVFYRKALHIWRISNAAWQNSKAFYGLLKVATERGFIAADSIPMAYIQSDRKLPGAYVTVFVQICQITQKCFLRSFLLVSPECNDFHCYF